MRSRSVALFAFVIAMGVGAALAVALEDFNAGISLGAAMFVAFAVLARRNRKNQGSENGE